MNLTKVCSRCNNELELSKFAANRTRSDGLSSNCKLCQKEYHKNHYQNNKDYYVKKARHHTSKIEQWVREFKQKPCADCGKEYPYYVMQFDHLSDKEFVLAKARLFSKEKILEEIHKCEVVCANCHAERTHKRRQK